MADFAAFDVDAAELMLKKGVKASQLLKRLRKITIAASDGLPPLRVLYCGSYGGYGYNESYKTFCRENKPMPDSLATIACGLHPVSNRLDDIDDEYRADEYRADEYSDWSWYRRKSENEDEEKEKDESEDEDGEEEKDESEDEDEDGEEEKDESEDGDGEGEKEKDESEDMDKDEDEDEDEDEKYQNREKERRIRNVQRVIQYGEHLLGKWPGVAKLVKAYVRNDLGNRTRDIDSMERDRKSLARYQKISAKLSASIAAGGGGRKGVKKWSEYFYYRDDEDFSSYAPSALKAMRTALDKELNKLTRAIESKHDALLEHMPETQYRAMLQSRVTKLPGEVEAKAKKKSSLSIFSEFNEEEFKEEKRIESMTFDEAVEEYGEYSYALWKRQDSHFDVNAMRFLLLHPDDTERLASKHGHLDCALDLGLCAASCELCTLRMKEVPCMAEWYIGEYNGNESINLV